MEGATTIVSAFTTAATNIATQATDVIMALLPIGLPILGLMVVIRLGKNVVKTTMSGK